MGTNRLYNGDEFGFSKRERKVVYQVKGTAFNFHSTKQPDVYTTINFVMNSYGVSTRVDLYWTLV